MQLNIFLLSKLGIFTSCPPLDPQISFPGTWYPRRFPGTTLGISFIIRFWFRFSITRRLLLLWTKFTNNWGLMYPERVWKRSLTSHLPASTYLRTKIREMGLLWVSRILQQLILTFSMTWLKILLFGVSSRYGLAMNTKYYMLVSDFKSLPVSFIGQPKGWLHSRNYRNDKSNSFSFEGSIEWRCGRIQ